MEQKEKATRAQKMVWNQSSWNSTYINLQQVFSKWIQLNLEQAGQAVEISADTLISDLKTGEILLALVENLVNEKSKIKVCWFS